MDKDIYTIKDIAEQIQVKPSTVRKLIRDGKLEAFKSCHKWLIPAKSYRTFVSAERII